MGRRNRNARNKIYTTVMSIPLSKPVLRVVDAPKRIKKAGQALYNPSLGRLRAWADPFTGVTGMIGVAY